MCRFLLQIWKDPVWSKVIAAAILAVAGTAVYNLWAKAVAAITKAFPTISASVLDIGFLAFLATLSAWIVWLIGQSLCRVWWARQKSLSVVPRSSSEARTKAADVVFGSATRDNPDARLGYHAHQLVHYAKFGKVIFYGKKNPSPAMKPISRYDLSTGRRADDMRSWITEDSEEYGDLSVRHRDLRRVVRLVQRAVKVHQAQHANAPLRSPDSED